MSGDILNFFINIYHFSVIRSSLENFSATLKFLKGCKKFHFEFSDMINKVYVVFILKKNSIPPTSFIEIKALSKILL